MKQLITIASALIVANTVSQVISLGITRLTLRGTLDALLSEDTSEE